LAYLRGLPRTAEVHRAEGDYFFRQSNGDSAIAAYRLAVRAAPGDAAMLNALALAQKHFGQPEAAEATLIEATAVDPVFIHTYINLGNLHFVNNEMDQAVASYRHAVNIDSTAYLPWFNLGMAYEKLEDSDNAARSYFKAIQCDPDDPKTYERLGDVYYGKGLYKSARTRWTEALDRDPARDDIRGKLKMLQDWYDSSGTQ